MPAPTSVPPAPAQKRSTPREELQVREDVPQDHPSLFERATVGLFEFSPTSSRFRANTALAKTLGYESVKELLAAPVEALKCHLSHSDLSALQGLLADLTSVEDYELELTRVDGSKVWCSLDVARRGTTPQTTLIEGSLEDISAQKSAEADVAHAAIAAAYARRGAISTELTIIGVFTGIIWALAAHFNWFEAGTAWIMANRGPGQMDDILVTSIFLIIALLTFCVRRWRESQREIESARKVQDALARSREALEERFHQRTADLRIANEELRREAAQLSQADATLRLRGAALTAAANAIVITDTEGVIVSVNPAFTQLTGYSEAEAIGRNPRELVKSSRQDPRTYKELWETVRAGKVWSGEMINRRKDGTLYPEFQVVTPLRNTQGEITHFIAIKEDLSTKKRAEEALKQSEERYRLLFENNPVPMWISNSETQRFLAVNKAAINHYGYTEAEFLAMSAIDIRPPDDVAEFLKVVQSTPPSATRTTKARHQRKDGSLIRVEVISHPVTFGGQEVRLVLVTDITDRTLLEEKFFHAQRLESIGLLAAGIAHDLNNVLSPIMCSAPMLRDSLNNPGDLEILEILELSAARSAALVKQILGFAHSTSGELQSTQIKHVAREVIGLIMETFPKSIRVQSELPADLWLVESNPTQLHQVLMNLCVNARDAMQRGGTLRVSALNRWLNEEQAKAVPGARPGAWLVLEVADTGSGISPEVMAHIWEPFYTTKGVGKGTGLGLSTVRTIVENHHGFVEVETQLGTGTIFRIYLPATVDTAAHEFLSRSLPTTRGNKELILVVDDDDPVRDTVAKILEKNNYRTITAKDGMEALSRFNLRAQEIALVITDIDMPHLSGIALARILTRRKPDLRLLVMSGLRQNDDPDFLDDASQRSHRSFLLKPFTHETLLDAVGALLAHAGPVAR